MLWLRYGKMHDLCELLLATVLLVAEIDFRGPILRGNVIDGGEIAAGRSLSDTLGIVRQQALCAAIEFCVDVERTFDRIETVEVQLEGDIDGLVGSESRANRLWRGKNSALAERCSRLRVRDDSCGLLIGRIT